MSAKKKRRRLQHPTGSAKRAATANDRYVVDVSHKTDLKKPIETQPAPYYVIRDTKTDEIVGRCPTVARPVIDHRVALLNGKRGDAMNTGDWKAKLDAEMRKTAQEPERLRAITRAIDDAGFAEARRTDTLATIETIFKVHGALISAEDSLGSLAELRGQLEKVAQAAEKLRTLIDELPDGARDYLGFSPRHYKLVENPLAVLIERARSYRTSLQRDSGRPRNSNLYGLLEDLTTLWENELPNATGISKDGRGTVPYRGSLFDFVRSLLAAYSIRHHSADALGRQLYDLWRERRRKDELHAAGRCTRCEKKLQDKARYLCDNCFRSWPWPQATVYKPT